MPRRRCTAIWIRFLWKGRGNSEQPVPPLRRRKKTLKRYCFSGVLFIFIYLLAFQKSLYARGVKKSNVISTTDTGFANVNAFSTFGCNVPFEKIDDILVA